MFLAHKYNGKTGVILCQFRQQYIDFGYILFGHPNWVKLGDNFFFKKGQYFSFLPYQRSMQLLNVIEA